MKIPLQTFYLNSLKSLQLPEITPDDVDDTLEKAEREASERKKRDVLARLEQETTKEILTDGFKSPKHCCPRKTSLRTPKLVNFSCSQPPTPTPKTPVALKHEQRTSLNIMTTPRLCSNRSENIADDFVIPTPMMINALDSLQTGISTFQGPDILDFLDDSNGDTVAIEKHIRRHSELELTDINVVDYLLEITEDMSRDTHPPEKPKQHQATGDALKSSTSTQSSRRRVKWTYDQSRHNEDPGLRRMTRRRYLHSKAITTEEEESLKRLKKKIGKERRRERLQQFKLESRGSRKSSRRKSKVVCY